MNIKVLGIIITTVTLKFTKNEISAILQIVKYFGLYFVPRCPARVFKIMQCEMFYDISHDLVSWTILLIIIPGSSLVWVQTDIAPKDFEEICICSLNFSYQSPFYLKFFGVHPKICTHSSDILTRPALTTYSVILTF